MTTEKPKAISIDVPERFRDAYEGQWVKRRIRVSRSIWKAIVSGGTKYFEDDKILAEIAASLAEVFTDWNLEADDGPLPKPWGNPEAFLALADSDIELCAWVVNTSIAPLASLVESEKN